MGTTFTVICQWPPNHFHCLFASDHPTPSTVFCQCCGTHQDKTNQTQSNQKKNNKKKNKIRHNTQGDTLTQLMCAWLLGRTTDLLEIRFCSCSFWSFSLNCRRVPIFYIVHRII